MKHYRNLNGCVSKMHRVIYDAYDKGYQQGRQDYERTKGEWTKEALGVKGIWYRCGNCQRYAIADYLFCPHCGSPMTEDAYGTEEK